MTETQTKLTYSNPRKNVVIEDWPSGKLRTKATFTVEEGKGKERAVRVTVNPKTGRENAAKKLTYARKVVFVDGSDDRLYILELSDYGFISVMKGTFDYQHETIWPDKDERFSSLMEFFS